MWDAFYTLAENLGVSIEYGIFIFLGIGGLIFYARDFKIGALMHFFIGILMFMWFYAEGLNYRDPLIFSLVMLVVLALSLYATSKAESRGIV
jgi:hypothetical protein